MFVEVNREQIRAVGGIFGVLLGVTTWALPLAVDYIGDDRFRYVEPKWLDLWASLAFGVFSLAIAVVFLWVIHRATRNGVKLKDGQTIQGPRLALAILAMCPVMLVGTSWADVAKDLYPYAADIFLGGLLAGVMLVTILPPFIAGWLVGQHAGQYPFTIMPSEAEEAASW